MKMYGLSNIYRIIAAFLALALLSGCATGNIQPFRNAQHLGPATEGENRLWHAARKIEMTFKKSGQIYEDPELCHYLQGVMDRLYPEFDGKITVTILKAPVLNAFALPNGSIYVNTGLIAAMENEAQIAAVLAHEGIHFVNKHSALQRRNYHSSVGVSWAVALLGIPFLSEIISASSIFGYSQQLEKEADRLGHKRLRDAGYDIRQAPRTFRHLAIEAKANKIPEPFFFSTHPKLENRIKNFKELNASITDHSGVVNTELYQQYVAGLRPMVLREKIAVGKYESVIAVLTQEELMPMYGQHRYFYLAEAYRLRNQTGDLEKAVKAYETAASSCPDFAPLFKSLGIVYLKSKRFNQAVNCFERYLKLNPNDKNSAFVKQYLKQAKKGAVES
jgi:predicted Zn-dependent protease